MFGSLAYGQSVLSLALALIPVYLTYRVFQHYRYTKGLEKALRQTVKSD